MKLFWAEWKFMSYDLMLGGWGLVVAQFSWILYLIIFERVVLKFTPSFSCTYILLEFYFQFLYLLVVSFNSLNTNWLQLEMLWIVKKEWGLCCGTPTDKQAKSTCEGRFIQVWYKGEDLYKYDIRNPICFEVQCSHSRDSWLNYTYI